MEEASPFSSLEHATSFARDLWFNTLPIQSWLDTFSAHMHIGDAITIVHGDIWTGLLQFAIKYHKKFVFGFVTSTNLFLLQQILEEVQARYENSLNIKLEIASREEFTLIERSLTKLWEHGTGGRKRRWNCRLSEGSADGNAAILKEAQMELPLV
ncbi:uric acid degradation bifunctional protein TTL-like [Arachis duranensis]|uniref:Uric acid degradation bifunctional protein TTL-like n=1 Tax=Arachis duranensis TaxID=130453 RepID=A0A6P5NA77_ARADU|nr:uric acid degradation bifunctional protein TTL-like [Arachis duranensis]